MTGALGRTYGYDAAGHTTRYSSVTATFNNAGRLKTVVNGSAAETLVYNALGQRIETSGGAAGTVLYWYDKWGHLLGEYDALGNLIEETVWLGDTPVATLRPGGSGVAVYYAHTDQLNTPPGDSSGRQCPDVDVVLRSLRDGCGKFESGWCGGRLFTTCTFRGRFLMARWDCITTTSETSIRRRGATWSQILLGLPPASTRMPTSIVIPCCSSILMGVAKRVDKRASEETILRCRATSLQALRSRSKMQLSLMLRKFLKIRRPIPNALEKFADG